MKQIIQVIKKIFSHKFVRFLFAGGLNTLFSYTCFVVLMALINQKEIATTLNLVIAVAFNYFTSSKIVFRDSKLSPITIVKFYSIYGITYVLNLLHLHITVDIWGWNVYLSQLVTLCYMPVISFTLQRFFVFETHNKTRSRHLTGADKKSKGDYMIMKRVLMLGGSFFQIPSIKKAKEMGLYVITCDYLPDNPGHKLADEYYNVSTTDKEKVLELAQRLDIDGIVCYASDPAAPTAAYVSDKLKLHYNPYSAVEILSNKDLFRSFLAENGFCTPLAMGFNSKIEARKALDKFKMPVMIKPVDSCGSKGVTILTDPDKLEDQIDYALLYSRNKRFIIEEYVDKYGYQIAGDGFSVDGKLVFRCFANEHFDTYSDNRFVPIGESWPYNMSESVHDKIHSTVQRVFDLLKLRTGAYNFDIRIDKEENVYLMEIGARNGGNLIPQVIKYATGVDMVEYTIKAALGEDCSALTMVKPKGFWSCYMIHSDINGVLKKVTIDDEFERENVVEFNMICQSGDNITAFTGSNGTLGTMILKFNSMEEMLYKMDNMKKYVHVEVE